MQPPSHSKTERPGVKRHVGIPTHFSQAARRKISRPFFAALVVIRQRYAVRPVANPVHKTEGEVVENIFINMILEQDETARYANGFAKQNRGVFGVVQNIHEQAHVETSVGIGQRRTVKGTTLDLALRPNQELNAFERDVRPELSNAAGNGAVTTSNVQHRRALWDLPSQQFRQHPRAPLKNKCAMPPADPAKRPGSLRGRHHLSLFVVANECAAANAQHAQEKGAKDCLKSKEKPHGPEKDLSHLMEWAKTSNRPFPRNPSTSSKSGKKKGSSQKQAGFQGYTAQDSP